MALPRVNAVVVGSGAGGGVVACQLAEAGLSVVLLERGRWHSPFEERKDDLVNQRNSSLGVAYGPDEEKNPRVFVDLEGRERVVYPHQGEYQPNAACVGGGTVSYGAQAWRYMPQDFRMRSTYGALEGSTLDDWPISYDDLEPFYEKAEYELGVSGDVEPNVFKGPRRRAAAHAADDAEVARVRDPEARGAAAGAAPVRHAAPHQLRALQRALGLHAHPLVRGLRLRDERQERHAEHRDPAGARHRQRVAAHASATPGRSCSTSAGAPGASTYFDENDRLQEQPADVVVVSGGATESARLLLLSKSRLHPNGLGNRHDWVGRNLTGHTYTGAVGFFEQEIYDDIGPGVCISVCDYNHGTPGLRGGGMLANEFIRLPFQFSNDQPPGTPSWGKAHKDFMRHYYRRNMMIQGPTQDMPTWDGRVELDPKVKDHWGMPVLRISGRQARPHDRDRQPPGGAGGGVAQGGGRRPHLPAPRRPRGERPPAPVGHLPHGERPEDLGGGRELPHPRRAERRS